MGEVYRAHDPRLGRDVAIKVVPEHLARDSNALARFEREARAVAALSHPNILAIFDFASGGDIAYAVTELLEGETLAERVRRGPMPWREAVDVAIAVAEALGAAHSRGLIHRDLKPANIFLTVDQRVKLLDFGIARWKPDPVGNRETWQSTQSFGLSFAGTLGYLSPEQVRGESADAPSDIFSFGCVLHEMVTARRFFWRPSTAETFAAVLTERPAPSSAFDPLIPDDLDRVIARCLEKEPHERFHDAMDLVAALKSVRDQIPLGGISKPGDSKIAEARIDSIAVLPFVQTSNDPELEYLSDGITESLINSLSQLKDVRVVARSTAFKFKGGDLDLENVGRTLHVRGILTGRVQHRADVVNVQCELINVRNGSQVWGGQYAQRASDIFEVQERIVREITKKLRLKLSREQRERLTRRHTEDSEAYQLYLRGRYFWNKRTPDWMRKGIEHFQLALEKDPGYAMAYGGVADCFAVLGAYSVLAPADAFPKAKAAALKAIEIDKTLAEAYTSLAFVKAFYDWKWQDAEADFKRSIKLSPSYATAHQWYSFILSALGRSDEALLSIRKALELDPLSLAINSQFGWVLYLARQYDSAMKQLQATLEMDQAFGLAHYWMGLCNLQLHRYDEAIAGFETTYRVIAGNPQALSALGYAHALAGRRDEAVGVINQLAQMGSQRYVAPYNMAFVSLGLGDLDGTLTWLQKSIDDRSWWLAWLKVDPAFDQIRGDARFQALMSTVGLQ